MKLSLQIPLHTSSANVNLRYGHPQARARAIKKERRAVELALAAELPRLKRYIMPGTPREDRLPTPGSRANFFRVTIIRISAGELDAGAGIWGALKAVQDEVAAWLGIDDGPRSPASWRVGQQKCPKGSFAVRIEIEDDDPDPRECNVVRGPTIARLGPVVGDVQHATRVQPAPLGSDERLAERMQQARIARLDAARARTEHHERLQLGHSPAKTTVPAVARGLGLTEKALRTLAPMNCHLLDRSDRRAAVQAPLIFRRAFAIIPEEQDDASDEWLLSAITPPLGPDGEPPFRISIAGRVYTRRLDSSPALGEHWIYEVAPSAARADERRATT